MTLSEPAGDQWLVFGLAVLNVIQVIWLAKIENRGRRRRRTDPDG